jgi:threonine dehydrogenase-like Zn-dependent dehydrogenase
MKAAIIEKIGKVAMKDVPDIQEFSEYACLCKNLYAATCTGTDKKLIHNTTPWENQYPGILGHENVAEVLEVGAKVRNFIKGDIVLRPVYAYAGEERNGYCGLFGGFSEYGIITDYASMENDGDFSFNPYSKFQMKIPSGWQNDPSAVMFITLKETFSWLEKLAPLYGKHVGIIGAGTVGLFYTKIASIFCAKSITILDIDNSRFEHAKKLGADVCFDLTEQEKPDSAFDLLIDAAGILTKIQDFIPMVKQGGTFAVYGIDTSFTAKFEGFGSGLNFAFHNSDESNLLVHDTCVSLVNKGLIDLSDFHSSIMPFSKVPEAYKLLAEKKEFKVIFTI